MSRMTKLIRFVRHWHARTGVLAALFFMVLAITGGLLNHTERLQLDSKPVGTPWLMRWYGLKAFTPEHGYLSRHGYLASDGRRHVLNGRLLSDIADPLLGLAEANEVYYLATTTSIHIYDMGGQLIEKLSGAALPAPLINKIGSTDTDLLIETSQGTFKSKDGLNWEKHTAPPPRWSIPEPLPTDKKLKVSKFFAPTLPLERIVLDVHSGRIMGRHGPLVMDLAALVLLALSLSGIWIYLRGIRKVRQHKQQTLQDARKSRKINPL